MGNVEFVKDPDGWYWHVDNFFSGPFYTKQEAAENYKQELKNLGLTDRD